MDYYTVVKKLLGPIEPVGETNCDNERLENLENTIKLVDNLLFDIGRVSGYKDCQEYSRSRAGKRAENFLNDVKEE